MFSIGNLSSQAALPMSKTEQCDQNCHGKNRKTKTLNSWVKGWWWIELTLKWRWCKMQPRITCFKHYHWYVGYNHQVKNHGWYSAGFVLLAEFKLVKSQSNTNDSRFLILANPIPGQLKKFTKLSIISQMVSILFFLSIKNSAFTTTTMVVILSLSTMTNYTQ